MFREIGNVFDKKKKFFSESVKKDSQINNLIRDFLKSEFGDNLKGFSFIIRYDLKDNSLTITTDNKIIANELSMRLDKLYSLLRDKGVRLGRILVK